MTINFNAMINEIMNNDEARYAAIENRIRRTIGLVVCKEMKKQNLSLDDMQDLMGPPVSQLRRLLHNELGGQLTLYTICRALDILGLELKFEVVMKRRKHHGTEES